MNTLNSLRKPTAAGFHFLVARNRDAIFQGGLQNIEQ